VVSGVDLAPTLAEAIADPRLERFSFLVAAAVVWFASHS